MADITQSMNSDDAIVKDDSFYNKKITSIPVPDSNKLGILAPGIASDIANVGQSSQVDISKINSFSNIAQGRDQLYKLLDSMGDDPTVAAVLETYAEDATEYSENGSIIWAESSDSNIGKYINFLLNSLQTDKNIYKWVYSLCKYGDLYLRLYRQSDYTTDPFFNYSKSLEKDELEDLSKRKNLNEDININLYKSEDHYVHYIEMVPNPAEMFELTKFGKTAGYIKADINTDPNVSKNPNSILNYYYQYRFKKDDINIYNGDQFVHASLEDNSSRVPEEVNLFTDSDSYDKNKNGFSFTVKRGQSLLYNIFPIWRELSLLENSMLLNRITKSSIVRIITVNTGDMPKEDVEEYLRGIKQLMEQKSALNAGESMGEYANPGPVENNIYVPTNGETGTITTSQVGGDFNAGTSLPDIDYFTNKFFGALRIPKQYFGMTNDSTGFNGGTSLSLLSSRYAKMIKRVQKTIIQALTDCINLMLMDKNMDSYIGQFTLKMQPPTTQEEVDRRENTSSKVGIIRDVMDLLGDIDDPIIKLKITKTLLSTIITDPEVIDLVDEEISKLEKEGTEEESSEEDLGLEGEGSFGSEEPLSGSEPLDLDTSLGLETEEEIPSESPEGESEETLPTPEELAGGEEIDFTNNTEEF